MPVHQISVAPIKEPDSSSSRKRDKSKGNEGEKAPGRSESRSSNVSKASSSLKSGVLNSTSQTSVTPSSQDLCSSSGPAKVKGSDETTPVVSLNLNPDAVPSTKRHAKRRVRRRRESSGATGGSSDHVGQTKVSHSRSQKQTHTLSESSSDDEQHRREARSWIRQKARRKRSCSRHTQTQRDSIELVSVNSDEKENQKENQPPSSKEPHAKAHKKHKKEERGAKKQAANQRKASCSKSEEEPITKMYEEQGSGDPDLAAPSPNKCTVPPPSQNGASQQGCTDDELEVCRICHCEGEEECQLITPCRCTGTLSFVHQSCLHQWIKSSDTRCCELCKYEFIMETHLKPLRKWEKLQMSTSERRKIFCSVAFHLAAVVCVVWSLYVLIDRTTEEIRYGKNNALVRLSLLNAVGVLDWPFWTKLSVVAVGFFGGLIFMYIQCKVYLQLWRRLKAFNRIIFVQNCPDSIRNGENRSASAPQRNGMHGEVEVPLLLTHTNSESIAVAPV